MSFIEQPRRYSCGQRLVYVLISINCIHPWPKVIPLPILLVQMPANWGARYPRRRNHPTRPRVRLDARGRPSPSSSSLLLTLGAPLAIVENSGKHSSAQLAGKGDTSSGVDSTRSRAVRFDSVIKLVLVPARSDLGERTKDLWWQEEDYFQFR